MFVVLQTSSSSEPGMSSLGALQFAAVGLETVNYGQLQQHLQRQVQDARLMVHNCDMNR